MRCEHCNRYARHLTPQLLPGGFGLVMKDACADRSCDDTPLGIQTRATALVRRQQAIQAHHDSEEVRGWRERHAPYSDDARAALAEMCPACLGSGFVSDFVDDFGGIHCRVCRTVYGSDFRASWTPMPPVHIVLDGEIHTIEGKSTTLTLPPDYQPTHPLLREGEEVEPTFSCWPAGMPQEWPE